MNAELPIFSTKGFTVTFENPKVLSDGLVVYREATMEIDASKMSQEFLLKLMWHMSEGHVRVKVARLKEQA
jgi:hypothetical protein